MTNLFYSLITLFIALFFILLGIIGIILPWSSAMKELAVTLILENSLLIFLFGFCFLTVGIASAVNILLSSKRHYYRFKIQGNPVTVDTSVIQSYLQKYFQELFPENEVPFRLQTKKNHFHLTADLPYVPNDERNALLERMKNEIAQLLSDLLGYKNRFNFSASFRSLPK